MAWETHKMVPSPQHENRLLTAMSRGDYELLKPQLEAFPLEFGFEIEKPKTPIPHVYFPESGLLSVTAGSDGLGIEAAVIGREGMSGLAVVLGTESSTLRTYANVPGNSFRIASPALRKAMGESPSLREFLNKFALNMVTQLAYAVVAASSANIEERLARWLLMAQDRTGQELSLTHDSLAASLGVRRAGVTVALNALAEKSLIVNSRGRVSIADTAGLKRIAGKLYGAPEDEYRALTGCSPFHVTDRTAKSPGIGRLTVDVNSILGGRRILVVEDDQYVAMELVRDLARRGTMIVGPVASLNDALAVAQQTEGIDLAVLDVSLRGQLVFPVVDALKAKSVAVVFATCYDQSAIPARYLNLPRCEKPIRAAQLARLVAQTLSWPGS